MTRDDERHPAPAPTRCRKVKEEFVLVFRRQEPGRRLTFAIRQHVSDCPECARQAEHTRRIVTIVRERCERRQAPVNLRERIIDHLRGR